MTPASPCVGDEFYMSLALEQARTAESLGEVPVGALIVHDGRVLAAAHNRTIASHDPGAHAEMLALRLAGSRLCNHRLPDAVMYATLEPCAMCYAAIVHARLKRLVYAAADPKSGVLGGAADWSNLPFFNHRLELKGGVLAHEAGNILKSFFQGRR